MSLKWIYFSELKLYGLPQIFENLGLRLIFLKIMIGNVLCPAVLTEAAIQSVLSKFSWFRKIYRDTLVSKPLF